MCHIMMNPLSLRKFQPPSMTNQIYLIFKFCVWLGSFTMYLLRTLCNDVTPVRDLELYDAHKPYLTRE